MSRSVFLVVRRTWHYEGYWFGMDCVVKAFTDREGAEGYLWRCQDRAEAREQQYPGSPDSTEYVLVETPLGEEG